MFYKRLKLRVFLSTASLNSLILSDPWIDATNTAGYFCPTLSVVMVLEDEASAAAPSQLSLVNRLSTDYQQTNPVQVSNEIATAGLRRRTPPKVAVS